MDTISEEHGSLPVFDTLEQPVLGNGRGGSLARVWAAPRAMAAATAAAEELIAKGGFMTFSDDRVRDLARCWQVLDGDSDGLLEALTELPRAIAAAGYEPTPELVEAMVQGCPVEWRGSGVDFDTFVTQLEAHACARPLREASLREMASLATLRDRIAVPVGEATTASAGPASHMSYQRARGSDFGARFASERHETGGDAPPVLPGYAIRRLLTTALLSRSGAEQPALSDEDVDALFASLQIVTETDRLRLADVAAAVGGGLTHLLPEAVERTVPHAAIRALFPGTVVATLRPPHRPTPKPVRSKPPVSRIPNAAASDASTGDAASVVSSVPGRVPGSVVSREGSTRGRRRPAPAGSAASKRLSTF